MTAAEGMPMTFAQMRFALEISLLLWGMIFCVVLKVMG